jgi:CheY-specific phosphatase CheX
MNFQELAQRSLAEAAQELLPNLGPSQASTRGSLHRVAAIIGFFGDDLRGTFGIAANAAGLEGVRSRMGASGAAGAAEDAIGELANLLVGHLKRLWSRHGALISISTPMVVRGLSIEVCGIGQGDWASLCLMGNEQQLCLWVDAHPEPNLRLTEATPAGNELEQGEALLF